MSSNGTAKTSWSTNARRSAGCSVSSTTSSAAPTASAASASPSGSGAASSARVTIGSGSRPPSSASSRRRLRASSIVRHTRETTVVSHAADVLHLAGVGAVDADPRLLQRVVGLGPRAEDPRRHGVQVRAVRLEFVHLVTSSRFGRQGHDRRQPTDVTGAWAVRTRTTRKPRECGAFVVRQVRALAAEGYGCRSPLTTLRLVTIPIVLVNEYAGLNAFGIGSGVRVDALELDQRGGVRGVVGLDRVDREGGLHDRQVVDVRPGAGVGGRADRLDRRGGLDERDLVGEELADGVGVDRRRLDRGAAEDLLERGDVRRLVRGERLVRRRRCRRRGSSSAAAAA